MKKVINNFFLFLIVSSFFCVPNYNVTAKSISNYREDLAKLKQEKQDIANNKFQTQEQINKTNQEIEEIKVKIKIAQEEEAATEQQIKKIELDIKEKEEQIKDLVVFKQLSDNENFYLKYIFGSESFTDLIYRVSVVEQLTNRNDELVKDMNNLIKDNIKKIKSLEAKQKELTELNNTLRGKVSSLGNKMTAYIEDALDIDAQIKAMEELIAHYKKQGCLENQDLSTCGNDVPFDNGFNKPLKTGLVTDEFGMRIHPISGKWKLHSGIDLGGNREGTPILSPASGKVVAIYWRQSCGGNQVVMNHIVNGKYYTTQYMHLLSINVSVGDILSKGQIVGTVGGGRGTSSYENCSTGAHLHFMIANGHYLGTGTKSYSNYSIYVNNLLNPRQVIWFPKYEIWW